jgi:hypothetical protein
MPFEYKADSDSYFLNHADFQETTKTIYAKGTITEWEEPTQEDPLQVRKCKVAWEDGETEFLPIFFRPKLDFWDDPDNGILSQDFDEEVNDYKMAWMSFRADDEVVIVINDQTPEAVIGFADGKPKIGEAVIKIVDQVGKSENFPIKVKPALYTIGGEITLNATDEDFKGPDGFDLKLEEESVTVLGSEQFAFAFFRDYYSLTESETFRWEISVHLTSDFYLTSAAQVLKVGPILYVFVLSYWRVEGTSEGTDTYETFDPPDVLERPISCSDASAGNIGAGIAVFAAPYTEELYTRVTTAGYFDQFAEDIFNSVMCGQTGYGNIPPCSDPLRGGDTPDNGWSANMTGVGYTRFSIPDFYFQKQMSIMLYRQILEWYWDEDYNATRFYGWSLMGYTPEHPDYPCGGGTQFPDYNYANIDEWIKYYARPHDIEDE